MGSLTKLSIVYVLIFVKHFYIKSMTIFLNILIQSKSTNDFRSFLSFGDVEKNMVYEIRGYGKTAGEAADDAWNKYKTDCHSYVWHEREWKE